MNINFNPGLRAHTAVRDNAGNPTRQRWEIVEVGTDKVLGADKELAKAYDKAADTLKAEGLGRFL